MQFQKKIHTHSLWKVIEFPRERGGLKKQKFKKQSMDLNWNLMEGEGVQNKNLTWDEYGYFFWNCTVRVG